MGLYGFRLLNAIQICFMIEKVCINKTTKHITTPSISHNHRGIIYSLLSAT